MELKSAIEQRQSIRTFTKDPVALADIREMIRRAGLAPSVDNSQLWKFIAVTNRPLLNKMATVVSNRISEHTFPGLENVNDSVLSRVEWFSTFFQDAPALIALIMKHHKGVLEKEAGIGIDEVNEMRIFPEIQSAGAAIQNILLSAVDLGYGGCWLSAPLIAGKELEKLLKIGPDWKLITMVAIGRPFNHPTRKTKKSLDEIFELIS